MFIKDMLREELENSLQIKKDYEQALQAWPRGALVRKIIAGHTYYYLAHRAGKKVAFDYLGKLSADEVKKYQKARQHKKRCRERIREVNKQIRYLRKILHAKHTV